MLGPRASLQHGIREGCLTDSWKGHLWASTGCVTFFYFLVWSLVRTKNCFGVPQSWVMTVRHVHPCWVHIALGSAFVTSYQKVGIRQLTHWSLARVVLHFCVSFCIRLYLYWAGVNFFLNLGTSWLARYQGRTRKRWGKGKRTQIRIIDKRILFLPFIIFGWKGNSISIFTWVFCENCLLKG